MAHCGGLYHVALPLIANLNNVVVDISGTPCYTGMLDAAVAACGIDNVLFGSDFPARSPWTQLAKLEGSSLSAGEIEQVNQENANRIFGLEL